jgi:carbonic anhydrase/acetyltransferase-like protein (isoleucine patch superfamily)
VLDHAIVEENCIIAAGALIKDSMILEPGCIYAGVPAKKIKKVDPNQTKEMIEKIANNYIMYADWFK